MVFISENYVNVVVICNTINLQKLNLYAENTRALEVVCVYIECDFHINEAILYLDRAIAY